MAFRASAAALSPRSHPLPGRDFTLPDIQAAQRSRHQSPRRLPRRCPSLPGAGSLQLPVTAAGRGGGGAGGAAATLAGWRTGERAAVPGRHRSRPPLSPLRRPTDPCSLAIGRRFNERRRPTAAGKRSLIRFFFYMCRLHEMTA